MTNDEFERLASLFQGEVRALEERLGEQIKHVREDGRRRGEIVTNQVNVLLLQVSTLDSRVHNVENDHRMIKAMDRGSQAKGLEHDAAIGLMKGEIDEIKSAVLRIEGAPAKKDSKAPATLAAIGEAQQAAARSRWLPIALGVATAIGTLVNVLIHK